ncbi:hypothetical protein YC2023_120254 [Brassica napus]
MLLDLLWAGFSSLVLRACGLPGMIFGGTAVQTLILIFITMRCDWEKERRNKMGEKQQDDISRCRLQTHKLGDEKTGKGQPEDL